MAKARIPSFPGEAAAAEPPKKPSRARRGSEALLVPNPQPDANIDREAWLDQVERDFVGGPVNKKYYRLILEKVWPEGHGIPGPLVKESELRAGINELRRTERIGRNPDENYLDVFRRVRELQGEEGVIGLVKNGQTYQLVDLTLVEKRVRRTALSDEDWVTVLQRYDNKCANCKRSSPEVRLQQDHKVPRLRPDKTANVKGGVDALENWQPLCDECNNFKSTSCRGCGLDCFECPWAFPERFRLLRISPQMTARLLDHAQKRDQDPEELLHHIIEQHLLGGN
jgi:hypothetical protein